MNTQKPTLNYIPIPNRCGGTPPHQPRDGDKKQARRRINVEVRTGRRPHPNTLPCSDCGHIWAKGERRHEYDHYLGYAAQYHYHVEPVCTTCHVNRDGFFKNKTHCKHGHEFTPDNILWTKKGTRTCRECRHRIDRERGRDAAFWRAYRLKRKQRNQR